MRHDFPTGHAPCRSHLRLMRRFEPPSGPQASPSPRHGGPESLISTEGRAGRRALLQHWDRFVGPIPESAIRDGLRGLHIDRHALWGCVQFEGRSYQRTRLHARDHYEVVVVCWRSGQVGPIHDQGGSTAGMLVVEGVATEIGFMSAACGLIAPSRSQRIEAGAVALTRPREIHQVANLEAAGTDLVVLQVCSPPPSAARCRRLSETTFADHDSLAEHPPAIRTSSIAILA